MIGIVRKIEQGTTTVHDAQMLLVWFTFVAISTWVLGFVIGRLVWKR